MGSFVQRRRRLAAIALGVVVALASSTMSAPTAAADPVADACAGADPETGICPPLLAFVAAVRGLGPDSKIDLPGLVDDIAALAASCRSGADPTCDAAVDAIDAVLPYLAPCAPPITSTREAPGDVNDPCVALAMAAVNAVVAIGQAVVTCVTARQPICDRVLDGVEVSVNALLTCTVEVGSVVLGPGTAPGPSIGCGQVAMALRDMAVWAADTTSRCVNEDVPACRASLDAARLVGSIVTACAAGIGDAEGVNLGDPTGDPGCEAAARLAHETLDAAVALVIACAARSVPACDLVLQTVDDAVAAVRACLADGTADSAVDVDCGAAKAAVIALVVEAEAVVAACVANPGGCGAAGPVYEAAGAFVTSCLESLLPALEGEPQPETGTVDCATLIYPAMQLVAGYAGLVNACAGGETPCAELPYSAGRVAFAVGGCAAAVTTPTPGGLTPSDDRGCAAILAEAARLQSDITADVNGCASAGGDDSSCDVIITDLTTGLGALADCAAAVTGADLPDVPQAAATCWSLGDVAAFIGLLDAVARNCQGGLDGACDAALDALRERICLTQTTVCASDPEVPALDPGGEVVTDIVDAVDGVGGIAVGSGPEPPVTKGNCGANNYWVAEQTTKRYTGAFAYLKTFNPSMPNLRDFSLSHIHMKNTAASTYQKPYVEIGWHKGMQGHNAYYSSVHYFYEAFDAVTKVRNSVTLSSYPDAGSTRLYEIIKAGRTSTGKYRYRLYTENLSTPKATVDVSEMPGGRVAIGGELSSGSDRGTQMRHRSVTAAQLWDFNGRINNWTSSYMTSVGDVVKHCDGYPDFMLLTRKAYSDIEASGTLENSN